MSGGEVKKLSSQDIELVQNRITQCLEHYMNKKEVVNALIIQGNIEPCITELVWQRLEEENHEFFTAYHLMLFVKEQIMEFNKLLSEQMDLMARTGFSRITSSLPSTGSHVPPTQHVSTSCPAKNAGPMPGEDMQQASVLNDCGSEIESRLQGSIIDGYAGSSPFASSPPTPSKYLESRPPLMGDACVDSNAQHLLDGDGFWAQMAQTFPADFTTSSESYCRPPFLAADADKFHGGW